MPRCGLTLHTAWPQGFTCLMQLSTRSEDFVVDTLALRNELGARLQQLNAAVEAAIVVV